MRATPCSYQDSLTAALDDNGPDEYSPGYSKHISRDLQNLSGNG